MWKNSSKHTRGMFLFSLFVFYELSNELTTLRLEKIIASADRFLWLNKAETPTKREVQVCGGVNLGYGLWELHLYTFMYKYTKLGAKIRPSNLLPRQFRHLTDKQTLNFSSTRVLFAREGLGIETFRSTPTGKS